MNENKDEQRDEKGPQVYRTTEYDRFVFLPHNRRVASGSHKRLLSQVLKANLLFANPIIVNEHWHVLDGQTRLGVAKELGVPIYYLQVEGLGDEHVKDLNQSGARWSSADFAHHYATLGYENYMKLLEISQGTSISIKNLAAMLTGAVTDAKFPYGKFKEGEFDIVAEKETLEMIDLVMDFEPFWVNPLINNRAFLGAVYTLYYYLGIKHENLIKGLANTAKKLPSYSSKTGFFRDFEEALNFNRKGEKVRLY